MGEVIQIHVGQAGVQIANACWELYCLEHGIKADGSMCDYPCDTTFESFFAIKDYKRAVPRSVFIDSEPSVIDQVRTGPYGQLYNPVGLITGKEDSGSNFARGYYTIGAELIDVSMEAIRSAAESCSNLKGILVFRSIGGGTGSGLGNLIAERLQEEYEKVSKMEFIMFPSLSSSPLTVEPYNALLATHLGMDAIQCSFILDNEALYDICGAKLNIFAPRYRHLNRIIAQMVSTFTTSLRFAGSSNISLAELETNLVPYPRIHFPLVSYAPFIPDSGSGYINISTEQMTKSCFDPSSQLVRCNPTQGQYMSSVLLYRGKVSASDVNESILQLRAMKSIRFVDWSPTGFKVGMHSKHPYSIPKGGLGIANKALVTLSNNTIIQKAWCRLLEKYDLLYSRRAFVHHYLAEGMEEDMLREASEDICALIHDYLEVDKASPIRDIPGDIRFNFVDELIPDDSDPSMDELLLPKLPGLQSLNYFFGDAQSNGNSSNRNKSKAGGNEASAFQSLASKDKIQRENFTSETEPYDGLDVDIARLTKSGEQSNIDFGVLQQMMNEDEVSCDHSSKRPKLDEARLHQDTFEKPENHYENFDQGLDTEAVRANERFSRSSGSQNDCQFGSQSSSDPTKEGVPVALLQLPPPRPEDSEYLGEAMEAKERFSNATFRVRSEHKNRACNKVVGIAPQDQNKNPIAFPVSQRLSSLRPKMKPIRHSPPGCSQPKIPTCFCYNDRETEHLRYVKCDDKVPPMCEKKPSTHESTNCSCKRGNDGVLLAKCAPYEVDQVICCIKDSRVCECSPESIAVTRPQVLIRLKQSEDGDDHC